MTALGEQTVIVPGTTAADTDLPRLADSLKPVLQQRKQVAEQHNAALICLARRRCGLTTR